MAQQSRKRDLPTVRKHGEKYVIDATCRRCGDAVALDCGELKPVPLAVSLARSVLCDECSKTQAERDAERERRHDYEQRVLSSGIRPQDVRGWDSFDATTPDNLDRGRVIAAAREWARMDDPGGLCLLGSTGTGKTALAKCAVLERLRHAPVRWVSLAHLTADLSNFEDRQARHRATQVLTGRGALALDDFDKVNVTDWLASQLFAAIDGRIEAGAALLVTTNLTPAELREKFGDAIYSRLEGYCRMVELAGPDYRLVNRRAAA